MFKFLFLGAFLNGLIWIFLIPIWQYPDEQSHFAQIQDYAEIGNVPLTGLDTSQEITISEKFLDTERDGLGNNKFTYHPEYHINYSDSEFGHYENFINQLPKESRILLVKREATHNPPLYHLMATNFYNLFSSEGLITRIYSVRIFSFLLYLMLVIISYNASKLIFQSKKQQLILTTLIAFTPMLVFSTTGVLPDPLTILLFTLIFTICLKIIKKGLNISSLLLLIVLIVLGTNTRQQFLIILPSVFLAVLYGFFKFIQQPFIKKMSFLIIFFVIIIIILTKGFPVSIPEIGKPDLNLLLTKDFISYLVSTLKHYYSQTLPWFWGVYKWLSLTLPHFYYQIINRIIVISLLGLLIWIVQILKAKKLQNNDLPIVFFIISIFTYFFIFIFWDFYFQKVYGYSFGIQGRYFLPLILPISSVIFFGLIKVFQLFLKNISFLYILLLAFIILFNDISLSFVASTYYDFSNANTLILQINQYKPEILKGYIILFTMVVSLGSQLGILAKLILKILKNYESY